MYSYRLDTFSQKEVCHKICMALRTAKCDAATSTVLAELL
jgi:hypothetical protein